MILGGAKGTKDNKSFYRVGMVRKTHRRKTHRRKTHRRKTHRKTSRRVHRRRTHRRGGADMCSGFRNRLTALRGELNAQRNNTIESFVGKVRGLYDDAKRAGCDKNLLDEIETFENGPVMQRANALLGN